MPSNKFVIGTIAHFYPTKGLIHLIKAAEIVRKEFPDILFTVIGDGQQRDVLQTEINNLDLANNFILSGAKDNAWQYLPAFDIYVCSSVKEGFPFSILEAMQAGLFHGYGALVDGMIERIREEHGRSLKVIATGGLAKWVSRSSRLIQKVDPFLTLKGLKTLSF